MLKEHPEMNISEIGDCTGFTSPRQFSRYFKEKYHLTPQAYRKEDAYNPEEYIENNPKISSDEE